MLQKCVTNIMGVGDCILLSLGRHSKRVYEFVVGKQRKKEYPHR